MIDFRLALRNLLGAGKRTWLNVIVLSMSFVIIIFYNGMMDGWNQQARVQSVDWDFAQGQLWHEAYDPFDPFTFQDAHAPIPQELPKDQIVPQLIRQASIYPEGRMQGAVLRGISADQQVLKIPTASLKKEMNSTPVVIGKRMARSTKLEIGDEVLIRWRDKNGTFDAKKVAIADIFDCDVPSVDAGQIWIEMKELEEMTGIENEATLFVLSDSYQHSEIDGWSYQSLDALMADIEAIVESKKGSSAIIYILLLAIALLAIFDTQVLSVFRRQKEIGTYIALGMTRSRVVGIFTMEGSIISLLAAGVGAIYGIPFLGYMAKYGFEMPVDPDSYGITMSDKLYPVYGLGLVAGTIILVVIAATIVSYMPARKIAKMNPTDALKGKLL